MSLLNVTVKRAKYIGAQAAQLNTYVTLKLQNVKSTTVTVKGSEPCWEQDFLFETNNVNSGLLVEVWTKGMIWDRALGYQLIPLDTIPYSTEDSQGQWYPLDMDIILMDGEVAGTKNPTGHMILLDCRFELPFDPESHPGDLQRKLEILNGMMTHDRRHRQAQYLGNSGYSEDSDYTSDLNYPVGQNANSSASQYRNLRTPQRSLETSRENSYEKDDRSYYDCYSVDNKHNMSSYSPTDYYYKDENDPLSYNSRPMSSLNYNKSGYGQNASILRKRSLERQDTLYDDYGDSYSNDNMYNNSDDRYSFYDANSDNLSEDRQWDSGGGRGTSSVSSKMLPKIPIKHSSSMIDGIYHRGASLPATPPVSHKKTRLLPQPNAKGQMATSLPATPRMLPQPKGGKKMPSTPIKRSDADLSDQESVISQSQYSAILSQSTVGSNTVMTDSTYSIRPHTSVSSINYNEDYNYAYRSTDSLNQSFSDTVSRRKGAALPSIPMGGKTPKFGQTPNTEYNSQSFDMDSTTKDYYGDAANEDYFYDNNLSSSTLQLSSGRRSKKLPTPATTQATTLGLTSSASMYSSTSLLSKLSSKLPQIPLHSSSTSTALSSFGITSVTSAAATPAKQLPSTPMQSTSVYDSLYTPTSTYAPSTTMVNDTYNDYSYTSAYSSTYGTNAVTESNDYNSYLYETTSYDTGSKFDLSKFDISKYETSKYDLNSYDTGTYETSTYDTSTYATSNFATTKYDTSISTPVASVTKSFMSATVTTITTTSIPSATTSTTTAFKPPTTTTHSTTSDFGIKTGSMLGSLTSGLKATMGGVVGANLTGSTSGATTGTSSLSSTATGYLGLMSKFLPNLTGSSSATTTASSSTATTTKPVTTTSYTSAASSLSNKYSEYNSTTSRYDEDYNYYTAATGGRGPSTLPATPKTTATTISQQQQQQQSDIYNYNSYYNSNSNLDEYNDTQYSNQPYNESVYPSTTTTVAATTTSSSAYGNAVDYSDEYKYGYDDYSYSENDYIATGDITDKTNYNNNYDIYDTTVTTSVTTITTTTASKSYMAGDTIQTSSSSIYDYDYDSGEQQYSQDIQSYNNRNSIYCDNSSNLITSTATTTAMSSMIQTASTTANNKITPASASAAAAAVTSQGMLGINTSTTMASKLPTPTTDYYMDQNQYTTSAVSTTATTTANSSASSGKKLPKINGKSSLLMKQQPTEIYEDEDEIPMHDEDEDIEDHLMNEHSDQDDYYMDHHRAGQAANANEYYQQGYGNANDTPYYDYREDYFNEEDEYKYLEKEEQQQHQQRQQQTIVHQKQPPLDFIEEARDDYMDNHIEDHGMDESGNYMDDLNLTDNKQSKQLKGTTGLTVGGGFQPHHHLSAQETIDDSTTDYLLDQQKQNQLHLQALKKQESILEEDEEQVPSPNAPFPPAYDQKDQSQQQQPQQQQQQPQDVDQTGQPVPTSAPGVTPTTVPKQPSGELDAIQDEENKKKTLTRGETEEVTSAQTARKPEKITARQRWNWAYNKIIMQLNVSSHFVFF